SRAASQGPVDRSGNPEDERQPEQGDEVRGDECKEQQRKEHKKQNPSNDSNHEELLCACYVAILAPSWRSEARIDSAVRRIEDPAGVVLETSAPTLLGSLEGEGA